MSVDRLLKRPGDKKPWLKTVCGAEHVPLLIETLLGGAHAEREVLVTQPELRLRDTHAQKDESQDSVRRGKPP